MEMPLQEACFILGDPREAEEEETRDALKDFVQVGTTSGGTDLSKDSKNVLWNPLATKSGLVCGVEVSNLVQRNRIID